MRYSDLVAPIHHFNVKLEYMQTITAPVSAPMILTSQYLRVNVDSTMDTLLRRYTRVCVYMSIYLVISFLAYSGFLYLLAYFWTILLYLEVPKHERSAFSIRCFFRSPKDDRVSVFPLRSAIFYTVLVDADA